MTVGLGIDTGGTYTDAVLVNHKNGKLLAAAKSLTTRQDLSIGIKSAISSVLNDSGQAFPPQRIQLVGLSTTLATNAIAEGHGAPVCLILIGYDQDLIQRYQFRHQLATHDIVYITGGHDVHGNERWPLDEKAARQAILKRYEQVSAFAVSGYFAVFNPAHELRVSKLIDKLTGLPTTCGHELSTRLDSIRRATTVALNARLIPIIQDLIAKVRRSLDELSIGAPLMVVKGDGSLVRAEWAMQRPVETVLSGPAASAVGAFQLARQKNTWAVDVGGTTTDIVALIEERPKLNPAGAKIGDWRTMVEAVDVHTVGLGGDSHVRCTDGNGFQIGPKRVLPLCKLASEYPRKVIRELQRHVRSDKFRPAVDQLLILGRPPYSRLTDKDQAFLDRLSDGPQSLVKLVDKIFSRDPWAIRRAQKLEEMGLVQRAGFTPTDALHVLNRFDRWDKKASQLAAKLLAAQAGLPILDFCQKVIKTVSEQLAASLIAKVIEDEVAAPEWEKEPTARFFLERALDPGRETQLGFEITLNRSIVALGAPVQAYMPHTADILHTQLSIPKHAEVASAIGAVSSGIMQRLTVYIRVPESGQGVRLHLTKGSKDFTELETAVRYARKHMTRQAAQLARQAGAKQVEIQMKRKDRRARLRGNEEIYLGTELVFMAFGRPAIARDHLAADQSGPAAKRKQTSGN
jgi:N-methylhydantoinase A/oxoprolinase/acetone carboxylase beta subunit